MGKTLLWFAAGAAVALLAIAALFALGGPVLSPAPAPPAARPPSVRRAPPDGPVFVPAGEEPGTGDDPAPDPGRSGEPPVPPDSYPFEVPDWWAATDRKFREKEVHLDPRSLTVEALADVLSREAGFPVRTGPELESWAAETELHLERVDGPVRAVVEGIARTYNLEIVLRKDALVLHRRGGAPDTREARAAVVQWTILEARERREGKRPAEPSSADLAGEPVDLGFAGVPLRTAVRDLSVRLGMPVYMDAALWKADPVLTIPAKARPLQALLEEMVRPAKGAFDVTARRVVLFVP